MKTFANTNRVVHCCLLLFADVRDDIDYCGACGKSSRIYAIYASEYQVLICGLFFFAMFLGNASTTVVTILEKNRVIKKRKD